MQQQSPTSRDGAERAVVSVTATDPSLVAGFVVLLERRDLRAVLERLNARVRFRFTGLYRVEGPVLRNLALFDRENPQLVSRGDINRLADTCCQVVVETGRGFATPEARTDRRLEHHAARWSAVQSYLGVPIRGADGRIWGTLCHFDSRPRLAPDGELALLEAVAALVGSMGLES